MVRWVRMLSVLQREEKWWILTIFKIRWSHGRVTLSLEQEVMKEWSPSGQQTAERHRGWSRGRRPAWGAEGALQRKPGKVM